MITDDLKSGVVCSENPHLRVMTSSLLSIVLESNFLEPTNESVRSVLIMAC